MTRISPLPNHQLQIDPVGIFGTEDGITDWFIPEHQPHRTIVFPRTQSVNDVDGLLETATYLLSLAKKACYLRDDQGRQMEALEAYRIEYKGGFMRGHRQVTVDGVMHVLRSMPKDVPPAKMLGLPASVRNILCSQRLGDMGGLVIVGGRPGHGKSTTCASVVKERVMLYGSFCLTVEDPPEYALHGEYAATGGKTGKIIQTPARERSFANDLRNALRCYPSDSRGAMLLVGEVRDSESAIQVLRAGANGQLVFMTTHAGSPALAISRFLSLASAELTDSSEAAALLSSSLRAVIHQNLADRKLTVQPLFSMSADSQVAALIRKQDIAQLSSEISRQQTLIDNGKLEQHVLTPSPIGR